MLTIEEISKQKGIFNYPIQTSHHHFLLRPLQPNDVSFLEDFLVHLSEQTRKYWTLSSYDHEKAQELCNDIGLYDKLRLVLVVLEEGEEKKMVGTFEFSMDLVENDIERFKRGGIDLIMGSDCRFGPCLSDDYQGIGVAATVFELVKEVARAFGKKRIILWGGVFCDNVRAIKFYSKVGFIRVGEFKNDDGTSCLDMILEL